MRLMIRLIGGVNRIIADIGIVIACALLVLMTSAVILQVVSREFRAPIGWTEEVALASMVWVSFLVGPWAYRNHQFTRIDIIIDSVSVRTRSIMNVGIHIFEALLLVGAIYFSWRFFMGGNSVLPQITRLVRDIAGPFLAPEVINNISVQNRFIYFILPAGFAGLLLVSVEHLLRAIMTLRTGIEHRVGFELEGVAHTPDNPELVQRQTDHDTPDRER